MIQVNNISLNLGTKFLFKEVNLKFTTGNCYGVIGANGSGKSTFLKILSGDIDSYSGEIIISKDARMSVLKQNQFAFDEYPVLETVIMGNETLYKIMKQREELYSKSDLTDDEGMLVAELEAEFGEMGGYEVENEAAMLLAGLGLIEQFHNSLMSELEANQKIRVLLAQALFGNPDILLLDEPTNNLDIESIEWLEEFLLNFENIVIVVSHDRHFLNQVCTHICDIDFGKIRIFMGNYDFWYESSQLIAKQLKDERRKTEDKANELKSFIQRFGSNASKARQATSRKKILDKLDLDSLPHSTRRFPYMEFKPARDCGNSILEVHNLSANLIEEEGFSQVNFSIQTGDKIAFVGPFNASKTLLFDTLAQLNSNFNGEFEWGSTVTMEYLPREQEQFFTDNLSIVDWLKQYSTDSDETYIRSFLGRMLFSGEDALKQITVLSGGEKVRCLLSRLMLCSANVMILDDPTNHLDLESITALNNALIKYTGILLFNSHDHQLIQSIANRIIEITPHGMIDRAMTFDEYYQNQEVHTLRMRLYEGYTDTLW